MNTANAALGYERLRLSWVSDRLVLVTADQARASAIRALCSEDRPIARVRFKQVAPTMIACLRERP